MQPIRVLFLAANPFDKSRLRLDEEFRDVELEISHGEYGDDLDPRLHPAVRSKDLYDALLRRRPHVVHFCGHSDTEGIYLDESDSPVPGSALRDLFAAFKDSIRLVVLNACATQQQAEAIRQVIPCAVGMASPISDEAATKFAVGFYRALAEGDSVAGAHRLGVNRIQIDNLPGDDAPRLFAGDGVDPETLHLVGEHASRGEVSIPEKVHVDRTEELALFTKMLAREVEVRLLFVEGQKGMGKTMLVDQFWKKAEAHARARVTFKRTVAPEDVLQVLADKLGPQLDVDPAALLEEFVVATAPATVGVGAIQPSSPARRMPGLSRDNTRQTVSLRRQTECFLKTVADCARARDSAAVLLFDDFDVREGVVPEWLQNDVLGPIASDEKISDWIVVVVAGETSPEVEFEARCLVRTLGGLTPRYVGEWANQLQLTLPADTIAYIHRNTEGLPHRLSTELFWFRDWSANRG